MKKHTVLILALATATLSTFQAPHAWSAPTTTAPTATPQEEIKTEAITLKHVPPSQMAFWLTPQEPKNPPALKGPASPGAAVLALPAGVESITPDDASGTLQAQGTAEGIASLRVIVELLDRPLRKVALEVQTLRLSQADVEKLQVDFAGDKGRLQLGFLRPFSQERLSELLDTNGANVLLDARITIANSLSGFFRLGGHDGAPYGGPNSAVQLTPTINNDGTVTVLIETSIQMPQGTAPSGGQKLQSVANVRDGDTIALGGFDNKETGQATLTFLTARIIRRADEAK